MSYQRISKYVAGCDGTKLAVDLYLPQTEKKVPLLVKAGYAGRRDVFRQEQDSIESFLAAEYAVAIIEVRGSGASYGVSDGFFGRKDGKDLAAVITSLAGETWCSGRVGSYGGSNYGMSQEIMAAEQPDVLKASIPCDCSMDFYDQDFPNGVSALPDIPKPEGEEFVIPVGAPVDEDPAPDYPMAHEADRCHERNLPFLAQHVPNMYRDDLHTVLDYRPNMEIPTWERMDDLRFGHVSMWSCGAWFDPGCTNKILTWKSWGGRLLIGPWPHVGMYRYNGSSPFPNGDYDWVGRHLEFFDAHLKDVENNISQEPPIEYYTIGDEGEEWHYAADFPVDGTNFAKLYFGESGALLEGKEKAESALSYQVREDIMIYGPMGRMDRNNTEDMTPQDEKSIVFTSKPLPETLEITGIPMAELWVTSTHTDGNFILCLEEVKPDGSSHFITEGCIRASHGKETPNAIYASMGIPYHRGWREDRIELSREEPLRLAFHLEAVSVLIKKGNRLRVSISCGGSGYQQPENFPEEMPVIRLYVGGDHASSITIPAVEPTATRFSDGKDTLYVFKRAIYAYRNGRFETWPCLQVYPVSRDELCYETEDFLLSVVRKDGAAKVSVKSDALTFSAESRLPERYVFQEREKEIPLKKNPYAFYPEVNIKNLYVATVACAKGWKGAPNPQLRNTFDLYIDLIYPGEKEQPLPCIVNIHGFGVNHHEFEANTQLLLEKGYAVASIDYRLSPPNLWNACVEDASGCIRYLKAHAGELGLDAERIGLIGGSMGGYLTAMLAARNGDKRLEGHIGGNTEFDSSVRAAAAYFAFTDFFTFGEDSAAVWPHRMEKVNQSDGPYAPLATMIGYVGEHKGMGELKKHIFDSKAEYQELLKSAKEASPISHVTDTSAPLCLVHGIYDCPIQVPVGQSIRMFEEYTRKGVKALLLCNNNGMFGEDPEVKHAVVEFLADRV